MQGKINMDDHDDDCYVDHDVAVDRGEGQREGHDEEYDECTDAQMVLMQTMY